MCNFKYKIGDIIMRIQNDVERNMLFAGEVIDTKYRFGLKRYKIKLRYEVIWTQNSEIWVPEKFCVDFDQENWDRARLHWSDFIERLIGALRQESRAKLALIGKDNLISNEKLQIGSNRALK